MKVAALLCCVLATTAGAAPVLTEDFVDHIDQALTWSAAGDQVRARLSGSLELEEYDFQPAPQGLVHADGKNIFNPRLSLFLDAQAGAQFYFFAQARLDQGFDPQEGPAQLRLDEYALRFTPWTDGRLNFQIGKFATVVGNWTGRHLAWDNPFITAPLPYENLTGIFDEAAANSAATLRRWAQLGVPPGNGNSYPGQYRLPIIWGPSYASGAAISGVCGATSYAFEIKNAALSSRPASWDAAQVQWQHPTLSGRLGYRPDESWNLGLSLSTGSYLLASAGPSLAPGTTLGDYREIVVGQDLTYAWHHLQFWAEAYEARFAIPHVGNADTFAYYFETKYKFTPQFFGAVRWNQQVFGRIPDGAGAEVPWGRDVWRIDFAASYRFTPHSEIKLQYSLLSGGTGPHDHATTFAAQFILRF